MPRWGIGVDIVKIDRFRRLQGTRSAHRRARIFTPREEAYCARFADPAPHLAGTFAAKEAAFKAVGGGELFTKFEIRRNKNGKPEVWKSGKKISALALSISHDGGFAVAVACTL